jgi:hypothetical protein
MALESGTFVSDLVSSNPPGTDPKNQGDDHLRLVKSVLQASFPNATKAFYFPGVQAKSANYTVLAADENDLFVVNASGATRTITLPTSPATGFIVSVSKDDASANTVIVDGGGAETINGAATSVLTTRYQLETYQFDGTEWKIIGIHEVGPTVATTLNSQSVDYTGVIGDADSTLLHASGAGTDTFTIPANSSVAYVIGTMITFVNESSGNLTIAITSDTMTDTDGNTGSRTLAQHGISTAIKTTATTWRISGVGMS